VAYAALDAHSLVLLLERLEDGLGGGAAALITQHTGAFRVRAGAG
jgi:hypothetical protein